MDRVRTDKSRLDKFQKIDRARGTISLCMIVRDEEENLGRCLESARSSVDEIIVVDTGSRDATPDLARRYGAVLHRFPWQDDFSRARNESLQHATGEWVLVLDADEELPPDTAQNLRQLAARADVEAWTFTIVSPLAGPETQQVRHPGLRMFRNNKAHLFEGRIHEQIKPAILKENPSAVIEDSQLAILHHGYGQDRRREKTLLHIAILKQVLAERPEDPLHHYNLALNYFTLGDLENSRRHYEAARELLSPGGGLTAAFFRNYSICLRDLGEYEQALDLVNEGIANFPDYPDLQFIRGQVFADLNMLPQAKASFLKCTRFRQSLPEYIATEGVISHLAFESLADICARERNFAEAVAYLEQVLRSRPSYGLYARLCSLLLQQGKGGSEAAEYLDNFQLDNCTVARLLFDAGDVEACLAWLCKEPAAGSGMHAGVGNGGLDHERPAGNGGNPGGPPEGGRLPLQEPLQDLIQDPLLLKTRCLLRLGRSAEAISNLPPCLPGRLHLEEILKQHCLALWLENPRRDASAVIAASGAPGNPAVIACRKINSLFFGAGSGAQIPAAAGAGSGKRSPAAADNGVTFGPEAERAAGGGGPAGHILDLALEALLAGEDELALAIAAAGSGGKEAGEAGRALGKHALSKGYSREAVKILGALQASGSEPAVYYLLGAAHASLNMHGQAFLYFQQAGQREPENELYAACALEQLAGQCLLFIPHGPALDDGDPELRRELFKLASLRRKAQRLREKQAAAGRGSIR